MLVKVILILAVLLCAYFLTKAQNGEKQVALRRIILVLFVLAAIISILFPSLTTQVAHLVGVGRGTDLLLYALVVAFISYAVTMYRRLNRQEIRITQLVRQMSILQGKIDNQSASVLPDSPSAKPQN